MTMMLIATSQIVATVQATTADESKSIATTVALKCDQTVKMSHPNNVLETKIH